MNVRAKFKCHGENRSMYSSSVEYQFSAVSADEVEENRKYHRYTPQGQLSIHVDNPQVKFELGKSYYIDFTEANG